jgi:hypothetical protein
MTMSDRRETRTEHDAAAAGVTYWATEFERVYLMTAARIRGEPVSAWHRFRISHPTSVRG